MEILSYIILFVIEFSIVFSDGGPGCPVYHKCVLKTQCRWKGWEQQPQHLCNPSSPHFVCCPDHSISTYIDGPGGYGPSIDGPGGYGPSIDGPGRYAPSIDGPGGYGPGNRFDPGDRYGDNWNDRDKYGSPERYGYIRHDPYYMDFYHDQFEKYYGYTLSKQAKEILRNYRAREECGVRNQSPADMARISSGYLPDYGLTSFGEFRWHVALLLLQRNFKQGYGSGSSVYKYHCGATLIHNTLLLTAAHCVKGVNPKKLLAHLGDWNLQDSAGELFPAIKRSISRIFIHNGYNPGTYLHDIALLEMSDPIDTYKTPHVGPVCLPKVNYRLKDQSKCFVVGWGDDPFKPNFGSNILKSASVTYISDNKECSNRLYSTLKNVDDKFSLDKDAQKCIVGGYGRDTCVGDGGGGVVCPLGNDEGPDVCNTPNCAHEHYFLFGVISFGSPVCGDESVTIITDVIQNLNWIYTVLDPAGGLKNYDHHYYDNKPYGGRSVEEEGARVLVNGTDS